MKESISIKNFGPVSNVEISDIKPLTVFIGGSATGKSTILKVIALFRYILKLGCIRSYLHHSKVSRSPFRLDFRKLIKENGLDSMVKGDTEVRYTFYGKSGEAYSVVYANRKLSVPAVSAEDLVFLKGCFITENRNAISSWLGNGLVRHGIQFGYYFNETLELFLSAAEQLKEVELPFINVKFVQKRLANGSKIFNLVPSSPDKDSFRLKEASSGMKTTVPLAVIARYMSEDFSFEDAFNRSVLDYVTRSGRIGDFRPIGGIDNFERVVSLHVEEPELSLDPDSQMMLMEFLIDNMFHGHHTHESYLMFATHSPYIVNYLNLLMAKYESDPRLGIRPDDVSVYLTQHDGTIHSVMVIDEHDRWVVDSSALAEQVESIYTEYATLRR